MRGHHADDAKRPAFAAAALESRRSAERLLMVVLDAPNQQIDVKLFDGELIAEGSGPCALRSPDVYAITALARVTACHAPTAPRGQPPVEINVAVTWAVVVGRDGPQLDVAGTAYVFHPCELRPEEFRARRDPFNTLDAPQLDVGLGQSPQTGPDRARRPRFATPRWPVPGPLAFPPRGPRPGWAFRCPGTG